MTEAMQMTVSSEMENRMDDSSSTHARTPREPRLSFMPWVETVMRDPGPVELAGLVALGSKLAKHKKGGPSSERPAWMRLIERL
jgi:hypothetical protein